MACEPKALGNRMIGKFKVMKIDLKNINYSKTLSESAYAFTAKVYIDGKYVADASNRGKAIVNDIDPRETKDREILQRAESYCAKLAGENAPDGYALNGYLNLSQHIDDLMLDHLNRKEDLRIQRDINKHMQTGLVFGNIQSEYYIIDLELPMTKIVSFPRGIEVLKGKIERQVIPDLKPGDQLLNTNIPEHILKDVGLKPDQYMKPVVEFKQTTKQQADKKTKGNKL